MSESPFLLKSDGSLSPMNSTSFITEDEFQALLGRFPQLLTDARFGEGEPRRWMLVRREMGVTDRLDGGSRWSVDHLFLDQDGIPTLVEVKRATDTRGRREVVAQMLDYAANAVSWWRVEDIAQHLEATATANGSSSQADLQTLLLLEASDEPFDPEPYWRSVQANLKSGRIRMIFVADVIFPELQRIVEFLNEQMNPAVVAALELRSFQSGDERLIVPRVIGQTQKAEAAKSVSGEVAPGDVDSWFDRFPTKWSQGVRDKLDRVLSILRPLADSLGTNRMSELTMITRMGTRNRAPISITRGGSVQLNLGYVAFGALSGDEIRQDILSRFNAIPGVSLSTANPKGFPTFPLAALDGADAWLAFEHAVARLMSLSRQASLEGSDK